MCVPWHGPRPCLSVYLSLCPGKGGCVAPPEVLLWEMTLGVSVNDFEPWRWESYWQAHPILGRAFRRVLQGKRHRRGGAVCRWSFSNRTVSLAQSLSSPPGPREAQAAEWLVKITPIRPGCGLQLTAVCPQGPAEVWWCWGPRARKLLLTSTTECGNEDGGSG